MIGNPWEGEPPCEPFGAPDRARNPQERPRLRQEAWCPAQSDRPLGSARTSRSSRRDPGQSEKKMDSLAEFLKQNSVRVWGEKSRGFRDPPSP
jgi:hypothetical protein